MRVFLAISLPGMLLFALPLIVAGCEERVPQAASIGIPAPFTAEDKVVPVSLDPARPQPPPPGMLEVSRGQERVPKTTPDR